MRPLRWALAPLLVTGVAAATPDLQQALLVLPPQLASPPDVPPPIEPSTSTIIDVLSSSEDFSTLLRLLQRTKLVPAINSLGNGTLFAPTNDAFARARQEGGSLAAWALEDGDEQDDISLAMQDNILHRTRGLLLYHLLNNSLPLPDPSPPSDDPLPTNLSSTSNRPPIFSVDFPHPFETLLFPAPPTQDRPSKPGPWLPTPKGQLGSEGQRVRGFWRARVEDEGGESDVPEERGIKRKGDDWIGVDGKGQRGVRVLGQPMLAGNGVVVRVDGVLEVPTDVGSTILGHPDLTYLTSLLTPTLPPPLPIPPASYLALLQSHATLTVFAPSNAAFARLPQVERTYLESGFAQEDVQALVGMHASTQERVAWREWFERKGTGTVEVSGGGRAWVELRGEKMMVGMEEADTGDALDRRGVKVTDADIYCENGVVHIVDDLLVPSFNVTTEKILIGLNATRFVQLLRGSNLAHYVNSTDSEEYTILAPVDLADVSSFPPSDGDRARIVADTLRYHILPYRLRPADLQNGDLLSSELKSPLLKNGRQVVPLQVRPSVLGELSDKAIVVGKDGGEDSYAEVKFAGVSVVGEPVEVGRAIIYLVETFLEPPRDFVEEAVASLDLSTFLASTFSARLDQYLRSAPGVTIFAPDNKAFSKLGLVRDFILLPEARSTLRDVLQYHVVDEVLYLEDMKSSAGRRKGHLTLEGSRLEIEGGKNGSARVGGEVRADGRKWNGESRDGRLQRGNAITSNGALHVVDQVILPPSVNITVGSLLRGAKASVMADLLVRANLGWVLDGKGPSKDDLARLGIDGWTSSDSPVSDIKLESDEASLPLSFTVLAPTDEAFAAANISSYLNHTTSNAALLDLLKLHILPSRTPIPTDPKVATRSAATRMFPPKADSRPLAIEDDVSYLTLLSATSRFGDLAFREIRSSDTFVVGIKGARGIELNDWADVGQSGRATPVWNDDDEVKVAAPIPAVKNRELVNGVTLGGGVFVIDSVLVPFHPTFAQVWGWTVAAAVVGGCALLSLLTLGGWWLWQKRRSRHGTDYEPVEEEED